MKGAGYGQRAAGPYGGRTVLYLLMPCLFFCTIQQRWIISTTLHLCCGIYRVGQRKVSLIIIAVTLSTANFHIFS